MEPRKRTLLYAERKRPLPKSKAGRPDCMCCRQPFNSPDVTKIRICGRCKAADRLPDNMTYAVE